MVLVCLAFEGVVCFGGVSFGFPFSLILPQNKDVPILKVKTMPHFFFSFQEENYFLLISNAFPALSYEWKYCMGFCYNAFLFIIRESVI